MPSGVALIGAHLLEPPRLLDLIFWRTVNRKASLDARPVRWSIVVNHARVHRGFPLYALPAQVCYLAVVNLPPLLLSSFYGAAIAGHCGVAYRLVAAPLAILSLPLGAIFTSVAS